MSSCKTEALAPSTTYSPAGDIAMPRGRQPFSAPGQNLGAVADESSMLCSPTPSRTDTTSSFPLP
eukprot:scaffold5537_cov112-Isochrysis_galbana.AAC.4